MTLFKMTVIGKDDRTETYYQDTQGNRWSIPQQYWGPDMIEVPIDKVKECEP